MFEGFWGVEQGSDGGTRRRVSAAVETFRGLIGFQGQRTTRGTLKGTIRLFAINSLCAALGYPAIPGWIAIGGDPCDGTWQGVRCDSDLIVSITLVGANFGWTAGRQLGFFYCSARTVTQPLCLGLRNVHQRLKWLICWNVGSHSRRLSNNHIGGSIPSNLPVTLQALFLSDNMLTGSIPTSLSTLQQLVALSLNGNLLSGEILDAFQGLARLTNL
ncbi:hypothetical protein RHMOL_Rhmol06G0209000 [Rhododendron molle]|uniref:Uncharacterized protein n=1 Tax=Rhododendron molle TaxID=49168 RepID=A0ACC0NGJ9_RHOML|nr:hypothetical protein RHMOL_Rhmol06G0209000 [Rhododendron molle]